MSEIKEDLYHLDLERSELEKSQAPPQREQAYRSRVYAELAVIFPPEWMHTTDISRKSKPFTFKYAYFSHFYRNHST